MRRYRRKSTPADGRTVAAALFGDDERADEALSELEGHRLNLDEKPWRKRKTPEADLQRAILTWFRYERPSWLVHHSDAGSADSYRRGQLKRMGSRAGWPDLQVLRPGGGTFFIEVKAPQGRLSKGQEEMHERLRALGFRVHVVRSLDECAAAVALEG